MLLVDLDEGTKLADMTMPGYRQADRGQNAAMVSGPALLTTVSCALGCAQVMYRINVSVSDKQQ